MNTATRNLGSFFGTAHQLYAVRAKVQTPSAELDSHHPVLSIEGFATLQMKWASDTFWLLAFSVSSVLAGLVVLFWRAKGSPVLSQ
jgi:hypothetical protein